MTVKRITNFTVGNLYFELGEALLFGNYNIVCYFVNRTRQDKLSQL